MRKIPRVRERTATAAELADETERCRRAREAHRPLAPAPEPTEGNLCACLVFLARWRKCCVCGSETLFVDERGRSDADFECGLCVAVRADLARQLRRRRGTKMANLFRPLRAKLAAVASLVGEA